jgi:hypothetical protein
MANGLGDISETMRKEELISLVNYLYDACYLDGFKIITWNGLGTIAFYLYPFIKV